MVEPPNIVFDFKVNVLAKADSVPASEPHVKLNTVNEPLKLIKFSLHFELGRMVISLVFSPKCSPFKVDEEAVGCKEGI